MSEVKMTKEQLKEIGDGIKIESLRMRDAEEAKIFLDEPNWPSHETKFAEKEEIEVHFPANMLESKAISRMIVFSSKSEIKDLELAQKMYF